MKYGELRRSLGQTIRDLRRSRGYSQETFAQAVGLHRTYISDIERGGRNVSLQNLVLIANTLEMPLSRLMGIAERSLERMMED
jgi:transcriptional regulator with XRE-family HTH domain